MLIDIAPRKNGIYNYLFRFDSENSSETFDSDRPLSAFVNKMI